MKRLLNKNLLDGLHAFTFIFFGIYCFLFVLENYKTFPVKCFLIGFALMSYLILYFVLERWIRKNAVVLEND